MDSGDSGCSSSKSILLLGNHADEDLLQILAQGFWQPKFVDPDRLNGHRDPGGHPRIGLVSLREMGAGEIERLAGTVKAFGDLDWIAVVTAASAARDDVREFIARHCMSYQTVPLDKERLLYALGHATGMRNLLGNARGEARLAEGHFLIIGDSPPMRELRRNLLKIARVDTPVLLTGESGTGKELAARTIHEQSRRANEEFVAINCAALSPSLIHAELFGAERGAFTGAHTLRIGQLEAAHNGTVFLDEIGDLHTELQGLLLRFLEEKSIRRLGGRQQIPVDVRVIAATNVDLEPAVKNGRFREDLYYRLNVIRVHIPPLRARREDIVPLAQTFLARFATEHSRRIDGFSRAALAALGAHDWPGNVRELLNRIRRAVILGDERLINPYDLELGAAPTAPAVATLDSARTQAERLALMRGLLFADGNVQEAASLVGVSRATFYRLLEKHALMLGTSDSPSHG